MKIVNARKKQMVRFDSLSLGTVFIEHCDGSEYVQMRIREFEDHANDLLNAVSLSDGELYYIKPDTLVEIVEAELHI